MMRTVAFLLAVLALGPGVCQAAAGQQRPNVVVILADDMGWGDLSLHGNTNLQTPELDRLARSGVQLRHFYVCPVCSPTRAEFLTGRYHPRGGVIGVTRGEERLDLDETTLAQVFQQAGYATGCFGKWHNGTQSPYHPNDRGFEEFFGFCSGHWGNYFDPVLEHNNRLVRPRGYIADIITDQAIRFIERQRRPFFCYVAYNTPHSPFQVPDRFYEKFRNAPIELRHRDPMREDLQRTRAVLAMCENLDWNVGRILRALKRCGVERDTVVVFFSDNGPNTWRYNGRMRGRKGSTDEGGVRSACFIRYPRLLRPGTVVEGVAGAVDLMPTLLDLAGIDHRGDKPLDGISLRPYLTTGRPVPGRLLFSHFRGRVSVRTGRFRLDHRGRLYDLESDPEQRHDVSDKYPAVARLLRREVRRWQATVLAEAPRQDPRPFPVGGRTVTWIPARDGVPHGRVRRSAPAPNCSYFTNWTRPEDRITWHVEVLKPGRYEATLYYACRPEDVPVELQLRWNESKLRGRITQPHDPPLLGRRGERVPRKAESYVKDFRPHKLGVIRLSAGRGELELRAVKLSGRRAIELRWLMLRRVE